MEQDLDQIIDEVLKSLYESKEGITNSINIKGNNIFSIELISHYLKEMNLIKEIGGGWIASQMFEPSSYIISEKGLEISKKGGWLKHLENKKIEEINRKKIEKTELKLAKSNIRANELNEKVAKRNKRDTIINIILGIINIGILIWQSLKPE